MRNFMLALAILAFSAWPLPADEGHHHEDLTPGQLGTVHFEISCAPAVQKPFERGVALLHSFWYEEAEKEFSQIAQDDPKCAMAHWGVAMSLWHQLWDHPEGATLKRGQAEMKKAQSLHPKTDRERDYIAAMRSFYTTKGEHLVRAQAYSKAMEGMYGRYPDDQEAVAFYGLSLLASIPEGDTTFANRKKAGEVLGKLFATEPNHPGVAHYLIHSYDKPQLAQLGLPAARRYAQVAPAAPHALHMPSHIFARLGLWQDDVNSNLASIEATRKTSAMHMGGAAHQFHAMDFLVYAYLQTGREAAAQSIIDEVKAMPAMENMPDMEEEREYVLSQFPAVYALELHRWKDAAALEPVGKAAGNHSLTYWARGIGAARSGEIDEARKCVAELEKIHKILQEQKSYWGADMAEENRKEVAALVALAEGKKEEALQTFKGIAEREEATGAEPAGIPAREMLADLLLEMDRPEQALAEYEADLKFNPNRFNGLYGAAHASEMAGKRQEANDYYARVLKLCDQCSSARPELQRAKTLVARN
jgi:tetratricopeptide (TPR) repeat protein